MASVGVITALSPLVYAPSTFSYTWTAVMRPVDSSLDALWAGTNPYLTSNATYAVQPKDRGLGTYADLVSNVSSSSSSGSSGSGPAVKQYWG